MSRPLNIPDRFVVAGTLEDFQADKYRFKPKRTIQDGEEMLYIDELSRIVYYDPSILAKVTPDTSYVV